jgi:ABC-2 type transport system permease protein
MSDPRSGGDSAIVQLSLTRFREFLREPEAVFWTFIFPILLATGLGIAFRSRPADTTHVGVLASARFAPAVRASLMATDASVSVDLLDDSASASALRAGTVALVVEPFGTDSVVYHFDAARPESRAARLVVDRALQRAAGRADPIPAHDALMSERGSRYIDFVLPGLLAMNLMGSSIWGIGFSIVDARRKRLLKRFVATPMSRAQYLGSFMLFRLALMVLEVSTLTAFGVFVFKVPWRGPLWVFAATCVLGSLMFGAIGLLIASRPRTIEGASGLMNVVMLPMWVGSGVFFASTNFPAAVQPVIQALPLTAVIDALRLNMLQGGGLRAVAGEWAIAGTWLVLSFVVAIRIFRWR